MVELGSRWPTAIDLFCGSGGATVALKQAHFRVVAAVDNDPAACRSYRRNNPRVRLFEQDIRKLSPDVVADESLGDEPLDLLIVCAPCQPFSSQNRARSEDKRALLLLQASRFARHLKPKVIFVENVPGLASESNSDLLTKFKRRCGAGYKFSDPLMVDAADFGVPQRRRRCLLFGTYGVETPTLPAAVTPAGKRKTVRETIEHLPSLVAGDRDEDDPLHLSRNHAPITLERLKAVPVDGGSRDSLPQHLRLRCHTDSKSFPDVYGRMAWDDVAPTLTTGCTDLTKGRFAHPDQDRAITLREAALLQTFPEDYRFVGSRKVIADQIGNAIPPALVRALAPSLRANIKQAR